MAQEGPPIKGTQHKKTPCSCNPSPTVVYLPQHCLGIYDKSIPAVVVLSQIHLIFYTKPTTSQYCNRFSFASAWTWAVWNEQCWSRIEMTSYVPSWLALTTFEKS